MDKIAIRIRWNESDSLDFIQKTRLFTEMVMDIDKPDTKWYMYLCDKTLVERLCRIGKITRRNVSHFNKLSTIINDKSFALVNSNWEWLIGKYEIK